MYCRSCRQYLDATVSSPGQSASDGRRDEEDLERVDTRPDEKGQA